MTDSRRITLVADELRGIQGGGLGTVFAFLAIALGRMGHAVDVLYFGVAHPIEPAWAQVYEESGVRVQQLPADDRRVHPSHFGRLLQIDETLRDDPPDVVIAQDLAAAGYVALRRRQLGLGLDEALFIVRCSGTRRWITDAARKVRVHPSAVAITVLEQAALELADVVVAESSYMVDWMLAQGWRLPETRVIPSVIETGVPRVDAASSDRVDRIVFFGRLEERKGIRPFAAALNELDPGLLEGRTLEFLGESTPSWPPSRVRGLLAPATAQALDDVVFTGALDRTDALARLAVPGRLAVMPSLEDNSPSTVYECLQLGVPFIASAVGGTAELVAPEDRERALFEPTAGGIAAALRGSLLVPPRPVRAAFDDTASVRQWAELVGRRPQRRDIAAEQPDVRVVSYESFDARASAAAEWVVLLHADDVPDPELVATLVRAQAASGADVVTCGARHPDSPSTFFLGEPQGLESLSNAYGTVALVRRERLPDELPDGDDAAWTLLAKLKAGGARIVSVPAALVESRAQPGDLLRNPGDALRVVAELEAMLPDPATSLARLAAGLSATADSVGNGAPSATERLARRARGVWATMQRR